MHQSARKRIRYGLEEHSSAADESNASLEAGQSPDPETIQTSTLI
jgi:hypothetical protein